MKSIMMSVTEIQAKDQSKRDECFRALLDLFSDDSKRKTLEGGQLLFKDGCKVIYTVLKGKVEELKKKLEAYGIDVGVIQFIEQETECIEVLGSASLFSE